MAQINNCIRKEKTIKFKIKWNSAGRRNQRIRRIGWKYISNENVSWITGRNDARGTWWKQIALWRPLKRGNYWNWKKRNGKS